MSNSIDIQRRIHLDRCKKLFLEGATIEHVVEMAWTYGYTEGDRDTGAAPGLGLAPSIDDAALAEINAEREAMESGCVEPPRGGWVLR